MIIQNNTENKKYKKNGSIELMRFVFSAAIVLFHISRDLWDNKKTVGWIGNFQVMFFRNGYIGVEFFFIVSGFLMARSIYKVRERDQKQAEYDRSVGEETVVYIWRKMKQLMPYYIPACVIMLILQIIKGAGFIKIAEKLPSLLFLQRTGAFPESFISVSWYISSMLIAMAVIYPICKNWYRTYTSLIAPLLGTLIIGFIIQSTGQLGGSGEWMLLTYKPNLRALAEIGIGTTCFEISRRLKEKTFRKWQQIALSITTVMCYLLSLMFAVSNVDRRLSAECFYLLCIAVTISFSGIGWVAQKELFQKRLFMYLGGISLPLYLLQNVFRQGVPLVMPGMSAKYQCAATFIGTLTGAVIMYEIVNKVKRIYEKAD